MTKGIAFLTTILILAIVVLICVGLSVIILRDIYTVKQIRYGTQAYFLAEAGIEEALKEIKSDFDWSPSGYPKELETGSGRTYSVTVATSGDDPNYKVITSTGTSKSAVKAIKVQVRLAVPEVFDYAAFGGGELVISSKDLDPAKKSVVSNASAVMVHSNSASESPAALQVGTSDGVGEVVGTGGACGIAYRHPDNGTVTGGEPVSGDCHVRPPPFDDDFFQYYYDKALEDSKVYNPGWWGQSFYSDPCAGTTNKIAYVNGNVDLKGTWEMTGCIVATGRIRVNYISAGVITQHQHGNLPAFMSKNGDVQIWDPSNLEGMIYAGDEVYIESWLGTYGPVVITNGAVYGRGKVTLSQYTQLHYTKPNPPGLPGGDKAVEIVSWSR